MYYSLTSIKPVQAKFLHLGLGSDSGKQREPARQNIGLQMGTKESNRPIEDSTMPKDTDLQDDELNDNQPEKINEDVPPGGPHKPEQPTNQGIGEETHKQAEGGLQ